MLRPWCVACSLLLGEAMVVGGCGGNLPYLLPNLLLTADMSVLSWSFEERKECQIIKNLCVVGWVRLFNEMWNFF